MAVGIQIGLIITPLGLLAPLWNDRSWLILVWAPVWVAAMTALMWLWFAYARYFGTRVVGYQVGASPPRWSRRVYMLGLTLLLWALLAPMIIGQTILSGQTQGLGPPVLPYQSIPVTIGIALGLAVLISAATWAVLGLFRTLRPGRCASCGAPAPGGMVVGTTCQNCGRPLAAWLYVDYAAREMAMRVRRVSGQ